MRVLILGGDGYLGWPTAMHFSALGHDVTVVDNYLRRNLCREQDVEALWDTPNLIARARIWNASYSDHPIQVKIGDLQDREWTKMILAETQPEAIIHYAEQPSAPYSMLDDRAAHLTLINNLSVTANLIYAVKAHCPDAHIIKLGTMGEYGTPNIDIEEGWLEVEHRGRKQKFLYPRQASSLYHTTKIMDTDLLWFYVRMWNLRVTDLMQGPVYGIYTDESRQDNQLLPFFNYDELFGTVVNRFIVQAVAGYPLTVYGKGGQTRGYLNIIDTLNCVRLSMDHPADPGELRIFNQFTETFTVNELAERVQKVGQQVGLKVKINHLDNPRKELEEHYYHPKHTGLLELGLEPHLMSDEVLAEMIEKVIQHRHQIEQHKIFRNTKWA